MQFIFALMIVVMSTSLTVAGDIYKVTVEQRGKASSFEVSFGEGKLGYRYKAFDPQSKKFVSLTWLRDEPAPKPAGAIWDHQTGRRIKVYRFPDVDVPLPIIRSVHDIKICPYTGGKVTKVEKVGFFD